LTLDSAWPDFSSTMRKAYRGWRVAVRACGRGGTGRLTYRTVLVPGSGPARTPHCGPAMRFFFACRLLVPSPATRVLLFDGFRGLLFCDSATSTGDPRRELRRGRVTRIGNAPLVGYELRLTCAVKWVGPIEACRSRPSLRRDVITDTSLASLLSIGLLPYPNFFFLPSYYPLTHRRLVLADWLDEHGRAGPRPVPVARG